MIQPIEAFVVYWETLNKDQKIDSIRQLANVSDKDIRVFENLKIL